MVDNASVVVLWMLSINIIEPFVMFSIITLLIAAFLDFQSRESTDHMTIGKFNFVA